MPRTTTQRKNTTPTVADVTVTVPPIVGAIVRMAEPNYDGLPADFIAAYQAMPALVAQIFKGDSDGRHFDPIAAISGYEAARQKADKHPELAKSDFPHDDPRRDDMTRAIAILNEVNDDLATDLYAPVATAAFYVGIALAAYVLTNGGTR